MVEKVLKGSPKYYLWLLFLLAIIGYAFIVYVFQLIYGLQMTGLTRNTSWGFYIAQFTYLVGVAAAAVMLVLPATFHHYHPYHRVIVFAEFLAIGAVIMCMLFIVVDMGQPQRVLNIILHPTPNSVMFWDATVLCGYLLLNAVIGWTSLEHESRHVAVPRWVKVLVVISIFWAFSIHTVTAFLYAGLPGRHYWLSAIMAARFLASAFCAGPSILLLSLLLLKRLTGFDPGKAVVKSLSITIAYAMGLNMFFYVLELFTAFYSGIPGHAHPIVFIFCGHEGLSVWLNGWMWFAVVLAFASIFLLAIPKYRNNMKILPWALVMLIIASWIDKGLGLLIGGFSPTPYETYEVYTPTFWEVSIGLGIFAVGALVITLLWKIALEMKREGGEPFELAE
ncbi:sulfate reduction electron transfer complex DsrMKJOP subunit DsrP [Mailhella massiliensis]|uniref:Polysulfide reductase NrfD n=1 Tax=Mailhella massiliensis TaxID=1903261 RepID=A0A921AV73_9BACT|nr:NrfD/PsrC family molybdoenzyme membrane anchor subunit [Mailhella massiliensis]HJD96505.1 polysulfide reductase NrfD [Mailhella massiliensis]